MSDAPAFTTLLLERDGAAALIRLNRPEALNALNSQLLSDLSQALDIVEADDGVGCIVLTGSDRAFAAGADIKEMSEKSYADMFKLDFFTAPATRIEFSAAAASWP
jgi:enoyl-CoA hydratase/carnithine racemase